MSQPATPLPFADESRRCRTAQMLWARTPVRERLECVGRFRHLLVRKVDALTAAVERDLGRPSWEVLSTDVLPLAAACEWLQRRATRLLAPRKVPGRDCPIWLVGSRDRVFHRPRGVVGNIGTWNYPIFLNGVPMIQALTAGNGILWKPSELVAASSEVFHALFAEAGFPADLVIRLPATREAGPMLAEADIDHLLFTGSAEVGRRLAGRLGERLISSTLELSGCDALIVLEDADLDLAVKAAWWGCTLNKGQTCMAVRRSFVHQSKYEEFLAKLRDHASPLSAAGPMHLALPAQAKLAGELVRDAVDAGAKLLLPAVPTNPADAAGFEPTVVRDVTPEMAIGQRASFAPIMGVMAFATDDELLAMQGVNPYALTASIFTTDIDRADAIAARLPTGAVTINDLIAPGAHPATPFGGRRASGWGSTQGVEGLMEMTTPQTVSVRKWTFRPHYETVNGEIPASTLLMRGTLERTHSAGFGSRMKGLWKMIRGIVQRATT